jgi:hypothetical protein
MGRAARSVRLGEVATIVQGLGTSGRAAGARRGSWSVRLLSVGDLQDDRLDPDGGTTAQIEQNERTERYVVRPDDVLVAARSTAAKAALVPPSVSRTLADATLLIVRAGTQTPDLGPYLWAFLTSAHGRTQLAARMHGSTVLSLSAASLADVELPLPAAADLYRIADLVEASERAYATGLAAAEMRRSLARDALVARLTG